MQSKRKWLPGWQREELVLLCLEQGFTRRQAAAWRRALSYFGLTTESRGANWIGGVRTGDQLEAPPHLSDEVEDLKRRVKALEDRQGR